MTLLVVELALPELAAGSEPNLGARPCSLGPKYLRYGISFLVIASYWTTHKRMFRYMVRSESRLMWLNVLLLECV